MHFSAKVFKFTIEGGKEAYRPGWHNERWVGIEKSINNEVDKQKKVITILGENINTINTCETSMTFFACKSFLTRGRHFFPTRAALCLGTPLRLPTSVHCNNRSAIGYSIAAIPSRMKISGKVCIKSEQISGVRQAMLTLPKNFRQCQHCLISHFACNIDIYILL